MKTQHSYFLAATVAALIINGCAESPESHEQPKNCADSCQARDWPRAIYYIEPSASERYLLNFETLDQSGQLSKSLSQPFCPELPDGIPCTGTIEIPAFTTELHITAIANGKTELNLKIPITQYDRCNRQITVIQLALEASKQHLKVVRNGEISPCPGNSPLT